MRKHQLHALLSIVDLKAGNEECLLPKALIILLTELCEISIMTSASLALGMSVRCF